MSYVLIVGGDQIDGIRQVLNKHGVDDINHWPGRKAGDTQKVIPQDTKIIVFITNWLSHSITHKVKKIAIKRGIKLIYSTNGAMALHIRLQQAGYGFALESDCAHINSTHRPNFDSLH